MTVIRPVPTAFVDSGALDLFRFSDAPVFEALKLNRAQAEGSQAQLPER
jgi:gentisate 1,2-dioxygenase